MNTLFDHYALLQVDNMAEWDREEFVYETIIVAFLLLLD